MYRKIYSAYTIKNGKEKSQMENQKLENLLNLALNATPEELEKSENLSVGYETEQGKWEVIVKYSGEPEIFENPEIQTVRLLGGFAILTLSQNQIERLANDAGVEFIEKPKRLFFAVNEGRSSSCINSVQDESFLQGNSLFGEGVLVGCVDSGIDYSHPDFVMKMEPAGFCGFGIRVYREVHQRDMRLERNIQKSK